MYKIGIIGEGDSVLGFLTAGFSVFPVESSEEAASTLHSLAKDDYAIIFITEDLSDGIGEDLAKYRECAVPAVILIPSKDGTAGVGMSNIRESVIRAVGADILFGSDET